MRTIEGVTVAVNEKMDAVQSNFLREDGVLFRTCEHGTRHPVGCIHRGAVPWEEADVHKRTGCCGCCSSWASQ